MYLRLPVPFILLLFLLAFSLSTAASVYYFNRRSRANRFFSLFLLAFSSWGITGSMYLYFPVSIHAWVSIQMACGILMGPTFYFFASSLIDEEYRPGKWEAALWLPSAWILAVSLARILVPSVSAEFAEKVAVTDYKLSRQVDFQYYIYTIGIFGEILAGLILIAANIRKQPDKPSRNRLITVFAVFVCVAGALFIFNSLANILGFELDPNFSAAAAVSGLSVVSFSILRNKTWKIEYLLDIISKNDVALKAEKGKSDRLLLNILPERVAEELKAKGSVTPVSYSSATVMFTDFHGFTLISEVMNPRDLVTELDWYFTAFEGLTRKHGIEKLKTIGDSYMCAGGIPEPNHTHAVDAVLAALEIQAFMEGARHRHESSGMPSWSLRIGIHSGPLVAGVIGSQKIQYDIWGDTVNTASRMESSGASGKVNISEQTRELVKDFFSLSYRGDVLVKNKGMVPMHFVEGILPDLSVDGLGKEPNEAFMVVYGKLREGIVGT